MSTYPIAVPVDELIAYCRRHHVLKLALFGSALGEDFREESDIDILVEFEPQARIGFLALAAMQRELAEMLHRPVDLVPEIGLKPLIREDVLDSARVLYAA